MISFDITTKCNLNCNHCRTEILENELTTNEIFKVIDNIAQLNPRFIALTGGEPFIRKDLDKIIERIKSYDIAVQINTNSLLIEEDYLVELTEKYGIDYIQVSLDGLESSHMEYRGKDVFTRTIEQMKMITKHTKLIINTTVSKLNINKLHDIAKYLFEEEKIDCYTWGLKRLIPTNDFGKKYFLQKDDLYRLCEIWNELRKEYKDRVMIKTDTPQKNCLSREQVKLAMDKYQMKVAGCAACNSSITIRANGDISPCTIIPLKLGNLLEMDIHEIMNTTMMQNLIHRKNFEGKCGSCENLNLCGGCRAIAYALTGNVLGEDGACFLC
ncbi:radical SAM/SPASM domain-containing protein [Tepidibacter thalassicus]|nr:radical SAM protein [Tepidibacter thalassicus]